MGDPWRPGDGHGFRVGGAGIGCQTIVVARRKAVVADQWFIRPRNGEILEIVLMQMVEGREIVRTCRAYVDFVHVSGGGKTTARTHSSP